MKRKFLPSHQQKKTLADEVEPFLTLINFEKFKKKSSKRLQFFFIHPENSNLELKKAAQSNNLQDGQRPTVLPEVEQSPVHPHLRLRQPARAGVLGGRHPQRRGPIPQSPPGHSFGMLAVLQGKVTIVIYFACSAFSLFIYLTSPTFLTSVSKQKIKLS